MPVNTYDGVIHYTRKRNIHIPKIVSQVFSESYRYAMSTCIKKVYIYVCTLLHQYWLLEIKNDYTGLYMQCSGGSIVFIHFVVGFEQPRNSFITHGSPSNDYCDVVNSCVVCPLWQICKIRFINKLTGGGLSVVKHPSGVNEFSWDISLHIQNKHCCQR